MFSNSLKIRIKNGFNWNYNKPIGEFKIVGTKKTFHRIQENSYCKLHCT